jgi:allantoinase
MGAPHRMKYFRRIREVIHKKSGVLSRSGAQIAVWSLGAGSKAP